jgi:hypothetical protein
MRRWRVIITWEDDEGKQHCRTIENYDGYPDQAGAYAARHLPEPGIPRDRGHNMLVQEIK